jgi:hypothetical protein
MDVMMSGPAVELSDLDVKDEEAGRGCLEVF